MNANEIAQICHEANRALCLILGDDALPSWDGLDESYRVSGIKGVEFALSNESTPETQHAAWMKERLSQGWSYGPILDRVKKIHPNLVPYHKLPREQKIKDHLFRGIVLALGEI
jgi:hypothetical protein